MRHVDSRKRYREIAAVLAHYGFDSLWSKWGIGKVLGNFEKRHGGHPAETLTQPERLRMALEELGTTFIKVGQMLSTRPDLFPPEYVAELSKLQDRVAEVPYEEVVSVLQTEFGEGPEAKFQSFDAKPRAAASIAQVHIATLPDGTRVAVKVKRLGIELVIEEDLTILGQIARFLTQNTDFGRRLDLEGLADEFAFSLRNELDFTREGQNAERVAAQFAQDPTVLVPAIYWDFSTPSVLTMDEIHGIKVDDLDALDAAGIDRKELAKVCAHIALVQVFEFGFFHADPHPGNFFVQEDGAVALIDYGMVGRLEERLRDSLLRLALAVSHHDGERLADEVLGLGAARGPVDRAALSRDMDHLLARFNDVPLAQMSASGVFHEVSATARKHGLKLPSELVLLAKVIAMDEGLGAKLDPDFNLLEFGRPYYSRFWHEHHSPQAMAHRAKAGMIDLADVAADLPERLLRLSGMIERGEVTVTNRVEVPEALTLKIEKAINRIAMSILTAGLIIGLSIMTLIYRPNGSVGFGFFLLKVLLAGGLISGGWLMVSFWRSTRRS